MRSMTTKLGVLVFGLLLLITGGLSLAEAHGELTRASLLPAAVVIAGLACIVLAFRWKEEASIASRRRGPRIRRHRVS